MSLSIPASTDLPAVDVGEADSRKRHTLVEASESERRGCLFEVPAGL